MIDPNAKELANIARSMDWAFLILAAPPEIDRIGLKCAILIFRKRDIKISKGKTMKKIKISKSSTQYAEKVYKESYYRAIEIEDFINEVSIISGEDKRTLAFDIDECGEFYIIDSNLNFYSHETAKT